MFCHYCGKQIKDGSAFCPYCRQNVEKTISTETVHTKGNILKKTKAVEPNAESAMKKSNRFWKLFIWLFLFSFIIVGTIYGLSYLGIVNTPFFTTATVDKSLEKINQKCIVVEELGIIMKNEKEGTATLRIQLPDYKLLFIEASKTENPEQYLLESLASGNYDSCDYKGVAPVTIENGEMVVHSEEVVHQLLEKNLISAINALSEVE